MKTSNISLFCLLVGCGLYVISVLLVRVSRYDGTMFLALYDSNVSNDDVSNHNDGNMSSTTPEYARAVSRYNSPAQATKHT